MKSFADLGVSRPVVDVLARRGVTAPFPVQSLVVSDVLEGNDVLVSRGGFVELLGGPGDDVLRGGPSSRKPLRLSNDRFSAGPGNDRIYGVDFLLGDAFLVEDACGPGFDVIEVLGVEPASQRQMAEGLRTSGCERAVFRERH